MNNCTKERCPLQVGVECSLIECPYKTERLTSLENLYEYQSPVSLFYEEAENLSDSIDEFIHSQIVMKLGVEVSREELIRALNYDRRQYEKGFADGYFKRDKEVIMQAKEGDTIKVNKIIKSTVEEELEITGATLLSIEEAEEYLTEGEREYYCWWWLCSSGFDSYCAAFVDWCGDFHYSGYYVHFIGSVRPALQIKNLESSNLEIGDIFKIGDYEFKVISEDLAWMYKQDIGCYAFNEDYKKGNDYETSDIKKVVDEWFGRLTV